MTICDKSKCTACGACRDACPKGCISFDKDEYGAETIKINDSICINCGRCKQVCQVINPLSMSEPKKTYAVCLKDTDIRSASASGGAAYALYSKIIEEGGTAYGATFNDSFKLIFSKATTIDELKKFQGSKYTFSDMNGTYKDILDDLKSKKRVIFIGTSCQCAAIKKIIPSTMHEQLILVDIICHGMPPAAYWEEYIDNISKTNGKISSVSFRDNNVFRLKIQTQKGIIEEKAVNNLFLANYTRKVFYRENCYSCKYACSERISDITIGDYWGRDRQNMLNPREYGMSVVLANSDKGIELFESCGDRLVITLKDYKKIVETNEQLRGASEKPKYRQIYLDEYCKDGFMRAANIVVDRIHSGMKVSRSRQFYREIKKIIKKNKKKHLDRNIIGRFIREHFRNTIDRSRVKNENFSILANDCLGGVISRDLGQQFRSPTVNLFIEPDDFVKFVEKFDYYKNLKIDQIYCDLDYPVGMIDDITIYFKNYSSFDEAVDKWKERISRINNDNIIVMMSDQSGCSYNTLERFEKLPYEKRVCFTSKNYPELSHCVQIKQSSGKERLYSVSNITNCFGKRQFQCAKDFDYIAFLNDGVICKHN